MRQCVVDELLLLYERVFCIAEVQRRYCARGKVRPDAAPTPSAKRCVQRHRRGAGLAAAYSEVT